MKIREILKKYPLLKYIFFFLFFSFAGFLLEFFFGIIRGKSSIPYDQTLYQIFGIKSVFIPFYGEGALVLILFEKFLDRKKIKFFLRGFLDGLIIIAWELTGGALAILLLNERFWDYSNHPFNFFGIISLNMSIIWIFVGYLFSFIYRKIIKKL